MQVDQQTFVSAYIERQQRAIADLTNKVVMLETQLLLAQKKIQELTQPPKEEKPDSEGDFTSAQVKEE
jgi:hypothetical protein